MLLLGGCCSCEVKVFVASSKWVADPTPKQHPQSTLASIILVNVSLHINRIRDPLMFDLPPPALRILMFRHLLIVPLVNHRLRVERLHADYSIMIEFGDY